MDARKIARYTPVCLSGSSTISWSKPERPFDIRSDVVPVIQMTHFTFVLYVNPSLPVKSVAELVAYAKANAGKLNYGSVGTGSTPQLAFEFLKQRTGMAREGRRDLERRDSHREHQVRVITPIPSAECRRV